MSFVGTDFQDLLDENYQDRCVAVEFEYAGYYKKAIGMLKCISPNFIKLVSNPYHCPSVRVTVFCGNNSPMEEYAKEIVIKKNNIVGVELEPIFGKHPYPDFFQVNQNSNYPMKKDKENSVIEDKDSGNLNEDYCMRNDEDEEE